MGRPPSRTCRLIVRSAAAMVAALLAMPAVQAQTGAWPVRTVRLVVGFPPGPTPDVAARILAEGLGTRLGPIELEVWTALVGPARLSRAAQERLAREVPAPMCDGKARQKLFAAGCQAQGTAPEALELRMKNEAAILGGIIAMRGIEAE